MATFDLTPVPVDNPEDNLALTYVQKKETEEIQELERESAPFPTGDAEPEKEEKPPIKGSDDPWQLRIFRNIVDVSDKVISDVGRGLTELPTAPAHGAVEGAKETLIALNNLGGWLTNALDVQGNLITPAAQTNEQAEASGTPKEILSKTSEDLRDIPNFPEPETVTGQLASSLSQFLVDFIPLLKGVRAAAGATKVGKKLLGGKVGQLAQIETAAAGAGALAFDPYEARLSNLIEEHPQFGNAVTEYLAASPDDTEAAGRFKSALEGLGLGALAIGVGHAVHAIKVNRIAKGMTFGGEEEAAAAVRLGEGDKSIIKPDLGPGEGQPFMTDEAAGRFLAGEAPDPVELSHSINWASFTQPERFQEAIKNMSMELAPQIDDARRGVLGDKETLRMAQNLGMTPEDLINRRIGGTFNVEQMRAANMLVEAAWARTHELATLARTSADMSDVFNFQRMYNITAAMQMQLQGAISEAGRAFRALQLPNGSIAKQRNQLAEMIMRQGGEDNVRQIAEAVGQIANLADFAKATRGAALRNWTDAAVEYWYFSLLSGPQTHAVNMTSNAMNLAFQVGERALAAQFGRFSSSADRVAIGEATQMVYAMVESQAAALKNAGRVMVDDAADIDPLIKVESRAEKAFSSEKIGFRNAEEGSAAEMMNYFINGTGMLVRSTTRALMSEDAYFKTLAKNMETAALAFRQATREGLEGEELAARIHQIRNDPDKYIQEAASDFANSATFTTPLGRKGQSIQQLVNEVPALKLFAPFIRTPTNLVKWAGMRSPLGALTRSFQSDFKAGGARRHLALARMASGAGLMAVAVDLALKGVVTGAGPVDKDLRRTWRRTRPPYSVKVGDNWYSYNRADPFGMLLGLAASYAEIAGMLTVQDREDIGWALVAATSQSVFSKTWMRGPADAVAALTQPELYGERWVNQIAGTFLVPTGKAQMTRIEDPVWRQVNSMMDAVKARWGFGYSKELPAMRNLWGEKILLEGGLGPDIISPIYKYGVKDSPIDEWMFQNGVTPRLPENIQEGVELTPHEYERLQVLSGNEYKIDGKGLKETLDAIYAGKHPYSDLWRDGTDGPDGSRADLVRSLVRDFREAAWGYMLETDPELRARVDYEAARKESAFTGEPIDPSIKPPPGARINEKGELEIDVNTPRGGISDFPSFGITDG